MNLLDQLAILNGTYAPKPEVKEEELKIDEITFTIVSTDVDLTKVTIDSFLKWNQYLIKRYVIIEITGDENQINKLRQLNQSTWQNKFEIESSDRKRSYVEALDDAYATIETPYIFHCESGWVFEKTGYNGGFINQGIQLLKFDEKVLQVYLQTEVGLLNETTDFKINEIKVKQVQPYSYLIKGAGEKGGDLRILHSIGFNWSPCIKRLYDWQKTSGGYCRFYLEYELDSFYKSKEFKIVALEDTFIKYNGSRNQLADASHPKYIKQPVMKDQPSTSIKLPSISIVMQAFLGEYPGSRSNSIEKFHRAIQSFLQQEYKNAELVVVSDGCSIVHTEILKYHNNPAIKYVYVDKEGAGNMYETTDGKKFYRGKPRQMGLQAATGELVTYMDSDDYLTPKFLYNIVYNYNFYSGADWWLNNTWYDHLIMSKVAPEVLKVVADYDGKIYSFEGLSAPFVQTVIKPGLIVNTPWLLTHRKSCNIEWMDTVEVSEDVDFGRRLRQAYPKGALYSKAGYIRCHYAGMWDV